MNSYLALSSQVFVDQLTSKDMEFIGDLIFPSIDKEIVIKMVEFSNRVCFSGFPHIYYIYLLQEISPCCYPATSRVPLIS